MNELRKWLAFGTGAGIEIRKDELAVTLARVRPSGVEVFGSTAIRGFRERPASEWGAEYARFLKEHGGSHLAATVVLPRREVVARQIALPGVERKDIPAAAGYQIDSLHPFGDDEVAWGWERVSESGTVLVGIVRQSTLTGYLEKFDEAGVAVASFTFFAAAYHAAVRIPLLPPTGGFLAIGYNDDGEVEAYGESASKPVFSATFDVTAERASALAVSELRLDPGIVPAALAGILPTPAAPDDFDLSRSTTPYAAALAGACPRLAAAVNLLPAERRSANSRAMFIPSMVLAVLLVLAAGATFGYSAYSERQYLATLQGEIRKLEPQAKAAERLDRSLAGAVARIRVLDEFRSRSKSDLDALNELTQLLEPPGWANSVHIARDSIAMGGEIEQAAPLLKRIDASPLFRDSSFSIPIAKLAQAETFRLRAAREVR